MAVSGILVVCTANQCRSPVAEALLERQFRTIGVRVPLRSAGLLEGGVPSPDEIIEAAGNEGLDLQHHRSVQVETPMLLEADLVIAMARSHVRELSVREPSCWPKTFTLRELLRRGEGTEGRRRGEPLEAWLSAVRMGRRPGDLFGADRRDDVPDPMGGAPEEFTSMVTLLERLTAELVDLLFPAE